MIRYSITAFLYFAALLSFASGAIRAVPSAYSNIDAALVAAQPGDTVQLADGVYNEVVKTKRVGTAEARITIEGGPGAIVKEFYVSHAYHTLRGFTVQNTISATVARSVWIRRNAHFLRLENLIVDPVHTLDVRGIEWEGPSVLPFGPDAASDCVITGCQVKRIFGSSAFNIEGERNLVTNCLVENTIMCDFIRIFGRNNVVRQSVFTGNYSAEGTGNHPDCYQTFGLHNHGCEDNIIEQNIFKDAPVAQVSQLENNVTPNIRNLIIRNNVFQDIGLQASCTVPGVQYYNNIFHRCNTVNGGHVLVFGVRTYVQNIPKGQYLAGSSYSHDSKVFNNVFLDCGTPGIDTKGWYAFDTVLTGVEADYNLVIKNGSPVKVDTLQRAIGDAGGWDFQKWYEPHGLNGLDPQFLDADARDYRWLSTSPLRDAGTFLAIITDDFDGNPRPLGAANDIGIFESGGSVSTGNSPVVTITSPLNNATPVAGSSITFTATATDVEDGNLVSQVSWTSNLAGFLGTGASFNRTLGEGSHRITARVVDSSGRMGAHSITVVASAPMANAAPSISITSPVAGYTAAQTEYVQFTATASDSIDGDLTSQITWTSSLEGAIGGGGSFTRTFGIIGAHTITASVTDSGGLTSSATVVLSISSGNVVRGFRVPLEWDARPTNENVLYYQVYERVGSSAPYAYNPLQTTSQTAIDVLSVTGVKYYAITAVNSGGESPFSELLEVTVINDKRGIRPRFKVRRLPVF